MKTKYLMIAMMAMSLSLGFTSCGDDDDEPRKPDTPVTPEDDPSEPTDEYDAVDTTFGIFVIGSGNSYNKIDGSLTYFDYSTAQATQSAFQAANGRSLGATPNDGVVYGTKLYLVVDGENRIEVVDAKTLKAQTSISTVSLLGETEGVSPRHVLAHDGKIYVSTYGGVVAAIDTVAYQLQKKYTVGSYPEGMALQGSSLYVANSDYGMGANASLSVINLQTDAVQTVTDDLIKNPSTLIATDDAVYFTDGDVYDWTTWDIISAGGLRCLKGGKVSPVFTGSVAMGANQLALCDGKLYAVKDAYTAPACLVYDTTTGTLSDLALEGLVAANAINIDPVRKELVVLSYSQSSEVTEYTSADYNAPGFANRYDLSGRLLGTFQTGVGPTAIVFNTGVEYVLKK